MKRHIPTFDQFVNEQTDANGYSPATASQADAVGSAIAALTDLTPGKEYVITLDGVKHESMVYQGVTGKVHVFNQEDHKEEPKTFTSDAISAVIAAGGIAPVAM
jgi:hypothetical protein